MEDVVRIGLPLGECVGLQHRQSWLRFPPNTDEEVHSCWAVSPFSDTHRQCHHVSHLSHWMNTASSIHCLQGHVSFLSLPGELCFFPFRTLWSPIQKIFTTQTNENETKRNQILIGFQGLAQDFLETLYLKLS